MEIIKPFLKKIVDEAVGMSSTYKRNLLKDYIQVVILKFIYSHPRYSQLVFYGGSCLRHCFDLPRLSEDLDFVDLKKDIHLADLASDIESYFNKNTDLPAKIRIQPSRVQIKFDILKELGLAGPSESDTLYLKLEVFRSFDFCLGYEVNNTPIFKFNRSMIIKTFDLPTMMSTKIGAVMNRQWQKIAKGGEPLAKVKGRDYFDLVWYLNKAVKPNLNCLMDKENAAGLKEKLLAVIAKVDSKSIEYDLGPLMEDSNFVQSLAKNVKEILTREIKEKL
ncbi:MAG: nucleotidyl transferase AbiEii/AbiGii toxin family protein [Candidatus Pacebacteria bacterium]|nr:nucleotidyl transferase AbiEii/AbiGii toxin family protein [Candidatus Paceibacterota bacterium]